MCTLLWALKPKDDSQTARVQLWLTVVFRCWWLTVFWSRIRAIKVWSKKTRIKILHVCIIELVETISVLMMHSVRISNGRKHVRITRNDPSHDVHPMDHELYRRMCETLPLNKLKENRSKNAPNFWKIKREQSFIPDGRTAAPKYRETWSRLIGKQLYM